MTAAIWALALPIIVANSVHVVINLTDAKFVSMLGETELAAVGLSRPVMFFVGALFMGIGAASTAMVARAVGAGDYDRADHVAGQAIILTLLLSVLVGAAGYLLAPQILRALAAPGEVLSQAQGYLRINFVGLASLFTLGVSGGILRGAGDAKTPLVMSAIAAALNAILDPLFIFGLLGLPALGVKGAAVASVLAQCLGAGLSLAVLIRGRLRVRLRLREFSFDGRAVLRMISIGLPASVQMGLRALMANFLARFVAGFGEAVLAAYTVGMSLEQIAFMPTFGIAEASAALVGQNLGARKPDRARRSALIAMGYCIGVMGSMAIVFALAAPHLMAAFGLSGDGVRAGTLFLRINALSLSFSAVGISLNRAMGGAGDTLPTMVFTVVSLWVVQVPLAWMLKGVPELGASGIWWAGVIASFLQAAMTAAYFLTGRWAKKKL